MEFIYRYYYTFFCLHLNDVKKGRMEGPAWFRAIVQLTAGVGFFMLGFLAAVFLLFNSFETIKGLNSLIVVFCIVVVPFCLLYYLLFNHYQVSKETGETPRSTYQVTKSWRLFFWIFWLASVCLPFVIALIGNGVI